MQQDAQLNPTADRAVLVDRRPAFSSRYGVIVVLLFAVVLVDGFDNSLIGQVAPDLIRIWSIPPSELSNVFAAGLVGVAAGAFLSGPLADRFGRKLLIILPVLLFGVGQLLSARAMTLNELAIYRFLAGIGFGGAMPVAVTALAEFTPMRWRALAINCVSLSTSLGQALTGVTAYYLLAPWGWSGLLTASAVLPIVLARADGTAPARIIVVQDCQPCRFRPGTPSERTRQQSPQPSQATIRGQITRRDCVFVVDVLLQSSGNIFYGQLASDVAAHVWDFCGQRVLVDISDLLRGNERMCGVRHPHVPHGRLPAFDAQHRDGCDGLRADRPGNRLRAAHRRFSRAGRVLPRRHRRRVELHRVHLLPVRGPRDWRRLDARHGSCWSSRRLFGGRPHAAIRLGLAKPIRGDRTSIARLDGVDAGSLPESAGRRVRSGNSKPSAQRQCEAIMSRPAIVLPASDGLFNGGRWHDPVDAKRVDVISPADGEVLTSIAFASTADIDPVVGAAVEGYRIWRDVEPFERARIMREIASVIRAHLHELALLDAVDCGNPVDKLRRDIEQSASYWDFFARLITEMKGSSVPGGPHGLSFSVHEPRGRGAKRAVQPSLHLRRRARGGPAGGRQFRHSQTAGAGAALCLAHGGVDRPSCPARRIQRPAW